jgi:hypothetical protein
MKSTHEFVEASGRIMDRAIPGFTTSTKTRPLVVAKLEEFIRNKMLTTYSSRIYHEFKTFIWNNGKPQAMRSYNDDLLWLLQLVVGSETLPYKLTRERLNIKKQ